VIGGVEGLILPGSDDPAGLYPIGTAKGGTRYSIYKAFLAVSASAAPFATVSVTRPGQRQARVRLTIAHRQAVQYPFWPASPGGFAERGTASPLWAALHRLHRRGHRRRADLRHLQGLFASGESSHHHRPHRPRHLLNGASTTGHSVSGCRQDRRCSADHHRLGQRQRLTHPVRAR
jgi:hypothetical protein